jgi:hypothetical protein
VIGLQLRFEYLQKDLSFDLNYFFECAEELETEAARLGKSAKWFVSTDKYEELDAIREKYGHKVVSLSYGEIEFINRGWGFERAVLDNELLSRCDELVVTRESTFGFVAAVRSGRLPSYYKSGFVNTKCARMSFETAPI